MHAFLSVFIYSQQSASPTSSTQTLQLQAESISFVWLIIPWTERQYRAERIDPRLQHKFRLHRFVSYKRVYLTNHGELEEMKLYLELHLVINTLNQDIFKYN